MPDQSWRKEALCRPGNGYSADIFFPETSDVPGLREAALICMTCPVAQACRAEADRHRERYGVWGAATRNEHTGDPIPIGAKFPPTTTKACGTPTGYRAHHRRNETACDRCREAERYQSAYRRYGYETR